MLYALKIEKAYDCVGASKIQGYGISLVEKVISTDPTAIIGLPLIKLCKVLRSYGGKSLVKLEKLSNNCSESFFLKL